MVDDGGVNRLLEQFGFSENPFALREADREGRLGLSRYFFQHPLFRELLGRAGALESTILFAPRGAGKTTLRQAIELYCREARAPVEDVLDVGYTDFSGLLATGQAAGQVTVVQHVAAILRCAVIRLLEAVDEVRIRQYDALIGSDWATLSSYIRHYSPLLDTADAGRALTALCKRVAADHDVRLTIDPITLLSAQSTTAIDSLPRPLQPLMRVLVRVYNSPAPQLNSLSYSEQLRGFLDLLTTLGYKAMYVLVDRLDEMSLLATPQAVVDFVRPLLTDLRLLDEPNLAFKIFLPQHLADLILSRMDFRSKRLRVKHLAWSDGDLRQLLARRLQSFNKTNIRSMSPFCEPELAERVLRPDHPFAGERYVDMALVQAAQGLPRDLILRCRLLFEVYEARKAQGLINQTDLDQAITANLGSDTPPSLRSVVPSAVSAGIEAPTADGAATRATPPSTAPTPTAEAPIPPHGLYLDAHGYVWRDGTRLTAKLRRVEYKLLQYLCDHRYELCSKEDILRAVWGESYAIANVTTTIMRLRDAVEYNPAEPRFLITVHGLGVRLEDGVTL